MPRPVVVLIPGFWIGPQVFDNVCKLLQKHKYTTQVISLPSTGKHFDGESPTIYGDVAHVRRRISEIIEQDGGKDVLVAMHAGGGIIGSMALQGLSKFGRKKAGKSGGVTKLVYIAALLVFAGFDWPHFEFQQDGSLCPLNPRLLLFNDFEDEDADKLVDSLSIQPGKGYTADLGIGSNEAYYAWADEGIQSTFLIATKDNIISHKLQELMAIEAGCAFIDECNAGHMLPLSAPECVVRFIRLTAGENVG